MHDAKNSEYMRITMEHDVAAQKVRRELIKSDPDFVPEFDRHWKQITDCNVKFWQDREAEVVWRRT